MSIDSDGHGVRRFAWLALWCDNMSAPELGVTFVLFRINLCCCCTASLEVRSQCNMSLFDVERQEQVSPNVVHFKFICSSEFASCELIILIGFHLFTRVRTEYEMSFSQNQNGRRHKQGRDLCAGHTPNAARLCAPLEVRANQQVARAICSRSHLQSTINERVASGAQIQRKKLIGFPCRRLVDKFSARLCINFASIRGH